MSKVTIKKAESPLARLAQIRLPSPQEKQTVPITHQLFLPGLGDEYRVMPNHLARSSLFAPVARGAKRMHKESILVSRKDAVITFWGEQLDEGQADVWMQLIQEAVKAPLGVPVPMNRARLLRAIGRQTGNYEYQWLHRTMKALNFAMIVLEVKSKGRLKLHIGHTETLHLVAKFTYDSDLESYAYVIDPRWCEIFANREYVLIDWEKRLRIRKGQDMAKSLQRLVATSDELVQRYSLAWLKDRMQYFSPSRKFKVALLAAMKELERVEVIAAGRIELNSRGEEQAAWTRM